MTKQEAVAVARQVSIWSAASEGTRREQVLVFSRQGGDNRRKGRDSGRVARAYYYRLARYYEACAAALAQIGESR